MRTLFWGTPACSVPSLRALGEEGHEIVTSGGIIGTVIRAEEDRLIIKTGGETKITVERSRVAHKVSADGKGASARSDATAK